MSSNPLMMDYEGGDLYTSWLALPVPVIGSLPGLCLQAWR